MCQNGHEHLMNSYWLYIGSVWVRSPMLIPCEHVDKDALSCNELINMCLTLIPLQYLICPEEISLRLREQRASLRNWCSPFWRGPLIQRRSWWSMTQPEEASSPSRVARRAVRSREPVNHQHSLQTVNTSKVIPPLASVVKSGASTLLRTAFFQCPCSMNMPSMQLTVARLAIQ